MSTDEPAPTKRPEQGLRIASLVAFLVMVAVATLALGWLERVTRDRISANHEALALQNIALVLPDVTYDNAPQLNPVLVQDAELLGSAEALPAYRVTSATETVAVVMTVVAPDAYVSPIKILAGFATDGSVTGARVLAHRETPGLGDQIEARKSDWIGQFTGLRPPQIMLREDGGTIDHISGATITSRAVTNAIRGAGEYYMRIKPVLTGQDPAELTPPADGSDTNGE